MTRASDARRTRRCAAPSSLAARGPAHGGNPQVGCVLLDPDGEIVAEGWHRGAGTAHAEVDALSKVAGRRRPDRGRHPRAVQPHRSHRAVQRRAHRRPASQRVVYAVSDPGERSGGGAERLRDAGVEVIPGVLADEVDEFLHRWLAARLGRRPWVIVKWASTPRRSRRGRRRHEPVDHRHRAARSACTSSAAQTDAILVGTGTVLADDPSLTARDAGEFLPHSRCRSWSASGRCPPTPRLRRHPPGRCTPRPVDLDATSPTWSTAASAASTSRAGRRSRALFIAGGFADELRDLPRPGPARRRALAIGDLGIATIAECAPLTTSPSSSSSATTC